METRIHMCINIAGAIRNKAFSGFTDDNGKPCTRKEAEEFLKSELLKGRRVLPMAECEGFDFQTGCPGHPINSEP
jgi:hypothetical protein